MLLNSENRLGSEVPKDHSTEIIEQLQQHAAESENNIGDQVDSQKQNETENVVTSFELKNPAKVSEIQPVEDVLQEQEVSNDEKKEVLREMMMDHADPGVITDAELLQEEIFKYNQAD